MNNIVVLQLGARMHYAVPRIFQRNGRLLRFYSDMVAVKGFIQVLNIIPNKLLPNAIRRLKARIPRGVPVENITHFPVLGLSYAFAKMRAKTENEMVEVHIKYGKLFNDFVIRKGLDDANLVFGFNSASLEVFKHAQASGVKTILEQTIAPRVIEQKILISASERYPVWAEQLQNYSDVENFCKREFDEWAVSDVIVCGSQFVVDSIRDCGGPFQKCVVVPYGVENKNKKNSSKDLRPNRDLRVLIVGAVGLRKGGPIVQEVSTRLGDGFNFRWVGSIDCGKEALAELESVVEVTGPVPRSEISIHYEWADVFFLPSFCEGSATVTYEAMMAGLPVICTPSTGSLVEDGISGYVIDSRDIDGMVSSLSELRLNSALLKELSQGALSRSEECSLEAYEKRLISIIGRAE